jgi:tRNA A37 threonylcarbamoyladenosine modification protein TsaB
VQKLLNWKKLMPKEVDLLLIALTSPIKIGIYENQQLIETIENGGRSSDVLPSIFEDLLKRYNIQKLFYANGPGSFMAIKVAYIFLKSMSILKNIPLFATDAFYFNKNQPIKAIGKLHFVKVASEIKTQNLETVPEVIFSLPDVLDYKEFSKNTTPLYKIGAVG